MEEEEESQEGEEDKAAAGAQNDMHGALVEVGEVGTADHISIQQLQQQQQSQQQSKPRQHDMLTPLPDTVKLWEAYKGLCKLAVELGRAGGHRAATGMVGLCLRCIG